MRTAELYLRPLTTVDHVELVAYVHHLRCGEMACGRLCRPASQYVQFEFLHQPVALRQLCVAEVPFTVQRNANSLRRPSTSFRVSAGAAPRACLQVLERRLAASASRRMGVGYRRIWSLFRL